MMQTSPAVNFLATVAMAVTVVFIFASCTVTKPARDPVIRIATFNIKELSREKVEESDTDGRGTNQQLQAAAEILQRVRPDILFLNEIDSNDGGSTAALFLKRYLGSSQAGLEPLSYPFMFQGDVNTGVDSGYDLDRDGQKKSPGDSWGFGHYPGQYGMLLLSRYAIDSNRVRSFQHLGWQTMPEHLMPDGAQGRPEWYSGEQAAALRLSSKSHWDVPVVLGERVLHVLASHPTPPVFDGDEDRNGRRNFDEIRLWADYLNDAEYLVDDNGRAGGLEPAASFVVVGDLNADPGGDDAYGRPAIVQLLDHPRVLDPSPGGPGGLAFEREGLGPKETWTNNWGRLDYVLPSRNLQVRGTGVFFPEPGEPQHELANSASDHRLVWLDVVVQGARSR